MWPLITRGEITWSYGEKIYHSKEQGSKYSMHSGRPSPTVPNHMFPTSFDNMTMVFPIISRVVYLFLAKIGPTCKIGLGI